MNTPILIAHCRRNAGIGGEDFALERLENLHAKINLKIYDLRKSHMLFYFNFLISPLRFIVSPEYLFFVLSKKDNRHIICNPFPNISLLSIFILGLMKVPLRLYVHNFSFSCVNGTLYNKGKGCKKIDFEGYCYKLACSDSLIRYLLNLLKHSVFYKVFLSFNKNKIYFVSDFQRNLAIKSGLKKSVSLVAGNVK